MSQGWEPVHTAFLNQLQQLFGERFKGDVIVELVQSALQPKIESSVYRSEPRSPRSCLLGRELGVSDVIPIHPILTRKLSSRFPWEAEKDVSAGAIVF